MPNGTDPLLSEIEPKVSAYAADAEKLRAELLELRKEIQAAERRRLKRLRRMMTNMSESKTKLLAAIRGAPGLFEKPRTRTLHGIKFGFRKGKGKVEFADAAKLVAAIKKLLPQKAGELIQTTETPLKDPLSKLTAKELKRLGVELKEAGDYAVAAPASGDLEKLAEELLGRASKAEEADG